MNFFGHLVAARRASDDPAFLLGAMLPDFVSLCGVRPEVTSPAIAGGVDHHHRADATFHDGPAFRALLRETVAALDTRGLARGPSRGAAHLAIELLLDGVLATRDHHSHRLYHATLAAAGPADLGRGLAFPDGTAAAARWWRLHTRLVAGPLPAAYADPDFVCDRTADALSYRPRLALHHLSVEALRAYLPTLKARVELSADQLTADR